MAKIVKYIIHKHDAYRAGLHYDLRIEIPDKRLVASWALPKAKVPENIGEKVLAVRTNDHGHYFLYIDHLEIPRGQLGGGYMDSIQKGRMIVEGWGNDYITFQIPSGPIMHGRFALIRFKKDSSKKEDKNMWILTKIKDKDLNDETSRDDKKPKV